MATPLALSFPVRPNAFPHHHRLLEPHQFQAVFDTPDYRAGQNVFLLLARANGLDHPRLGLVVGRRKAKRAVDRALIKRLARETFRVRTAALSGLDVVVLLRRPPPTRDRRYLRAELEHAWLGLLAKRGKA